MKFRNIITLLFAVTVFSSAYSMREGRKSPLSQEVDLSEEVGICDIYSNEDCSGYFQRSGSISNFVDLEEDPVEFFKRTVSESNLNRIKEKYEKFKNVILKFDILLEDGFESFSRYKMVLSSIEFEEYKKREYSDWIRYIESINKLKSHIGRSDDLSPLLKFQLIVAFDGLEKKLNLLLHDLSIVGSDSIIK